MKKWGAAASRGLAGYGALVLLPVLVGAVVGAAWWVVESDRLTTERHRHVAEMAAELLSRDLALGRAEFASRATATEVPSPVPPAVQRALDGDTVSGLASSETSLELTVIVADSAGVLRMIREPFTPSTLETVPSVTGTGIALYLVGRRVAVSEPALGPEELGASLLESLSGGRGAVTHELDGEAGVFVSVQPAAQGPPSLVLLVGERRSKLEGAGRLLVLFTVLLIILGLSATAAWTVERSAGAEGSTGMQTALLSLIPLLSGGAVLLALNDSFQDELYRGGTRQLSEAAALVQELRLPPEPRRLSGITGFEVAVLERGRLVEATNGAEPIRSELARIALPPPNWMASGAVPETEPPIPYESVRLPGGRGLVFFRTDLQARGSRLRAPLTRIAVLMSLPAVVFTAIVLLRGAAPGPGTAPGASPFVDMPTRRGRESEDEAADRPSS